MIYGDLDEQLPGLLNSWIKNFSFSILGRFGHSRPMVDFSGHTWNACRIHDIRMYCLFYLFMIQFKSSSLWVVHRIVLSSHFLSLKTPLLFFGISRRYRMVSEPIGFEYLGALGVVGSIFDFRSMCWYVDFISQIQWLLVGDSMSTWYMAMWLHV